MAIDAYMYFKDYNDKFLKSESQVEAKQGGPSDPLWAKGGFDKAQKDFGLFEVEDFSFDVEQTLNIGSQSSGTGAGKITFNPFSITRKIDRSSPDFFNMACSGTPFADVRLGARKSAGGTQSGIIYLIFAFKMVAVKTISWSYDDEAPKETVTFEYGGMFIYYRQQKPDGTLDGTEYQKGWDRVRNVAETTLDAFPATAKSFR